MLSTMQKDRCKNFRARRYPRQPIARSMCLNAHAAIKMLLTFVRVSLLTLVGASLTKLVGASRCGGALADLPPRVFALLPAAVVTHLADHPAEITHRAKPHEPPVTLFGNDGVRVQALRARAKRRCGPCRGVVANVVLHHAERTALKMPSPGVHNGPFASMCSFNPRTKTYGPGNNCTVCLSAEHTTWAFQPSLAVAR